MSEIEEGIRQMEVFANYDHLSDDEFNSLPEHMKNEIVTDWMERQGD